MVEYKESIDENLSLKGTVWLAGIPVINAKIDINTNTDSGIYSYEDYIGPTIDAGFRISKYSSKTNLVLSVEAINYFCRDINGKDVRHIKDKYTSLLFFDKTVKLKGVYSEREYPLFYLRINDNSSLMDYEDLVNNYNYTPQKVKYKDAKNITDAFIELIDNETLICSPYSKTKYMPESHKEIIKKLNSENIAVYKDSEKKIKKDTNYNELKIEVKKKK